MSDILANDVKLHYERTFATLRGIAEAFPKDRWLEPHGDEYYIPSRIAYHLASYIDRQMTDGYKDKDFDSKCPFGVWIKGDAGTLPDKDAYLAYYDEVIARAREKLAALDDDALLAPAEPERARLGASQLGLHLYMMREVCAHIGELNKMLIEDGQDDVWINR